MKKIKLHLSSILSLITFLVLFSGCKKVYEYPEKKSIDPFYYATFNIRTDTDADVDNPWKQRKAMVVDMVKRHQFALFGIQEGKDNQVNDLAENLPQYKHFGAGRDNGLIGEHVEIFYRSDLFEVRQTGDFWLSPSPESPGPGWDASLNRICSWGRFRQRSTGTEFYVFNTHIDHQGQVAQRESTALLLRKIPEIAGNLPTILSGDFNFDQYGENYKTLNLSTILRDCYSLAADPNAPKGTLNLFDMHRASKARIDMVFVTPQFKVSEYDILIDDYEGKLPSDHYPVRVKLSTDNN